MKKTMKNILKIIIVITVIIPIIILVRYAWSRYMTEVKGDTTADIAQFYFKVNDKSMQETGDVIFATTRDDSNEDVADNVLAPGTYGHIPIKIEATGLETFLEYEIDISLQDKPTNLKFYLDNKRTKEIQVENGMISRRGFISYDDDEKIIDNSIYWDWPLETGDTKEQIYKNDLIDSQFVNKTMLMNIAVTGEQVLESSILAYRVQIGDYVNYKASTGEGSYTSSDCPLGISISENFSSNDYEDKEENGTAWRVLSVDKSTGTVELMLAEPTKQTVTLGEYGIHILTQKAGISAYINAKTVLNDIGKVYGHGAGAQGGRSINIDDIMQYSNINPTSDYYDSYNFGKSKQYETGLFILGEKYNENDVVTGGINNGDGTVTAQSNNPVTVIGTYYQQQNFRTIFMQKDEKNGERIYNMLFKKQTENETREKEYWLASRCTYIYNDSSCSFGVRFVAGNSVYVNPIFISYGNANGPSKQCVPVVTLKSGIKTTGQNNNGVWQLDI